MENNNTFITFFCLFHKRGFVMAAFLWTLFVHANSYDKSISDISVCDEKLRISVDIYFSKKTLIQLEKIRRVYAKIIPSVNHKIEQNRPERNEYLKFFIFELSASNRKNFLFHIQNNTNAVFTTAVQNYNENCIHAFNKNNGQEYTFNPFFSDRFLFSLPPP